MGMALVIILIVAGSVLVIRQSGVDHEIATQTRVETRDAHDAANVRTHVDGDSDSAVSNELRRYQRQ